MPLRFESLSAAAHRWGHWYGALPFARKLRLFPALTAAALGLVLFVFMSYGVVAERRLASIGGRYYPMVEDMWRLDQALSELHRSFEDAVAMRDSQYLVRADSLARGFQVVLARHEQGAGDAAHGHVAERFAEYYVIGRDVSRRLMIGDASDVTARALAAFHRSHTTLHRALESDLRRDRAVAVHRFAEERERQRIAWIVCVLITVGFVIVVVRLARVVARALSSRLEDAVRVADRVAEGDLELRIPVASDEVGRLLSSMERMVANLRRSEDRLKHQATHDTLTGLANRALFRQRVTVACRDHADRAGVAVLYVDLDDFKDVNDALGHDAGDQLLVGVAERLLAATRGCDTVARLGGDEFAVLLRKLRGGTEAEVVAERIARSLGAPFPVKGTEVRVGASVGIALGVHGTDAEEVLAFADLAMYAAKRSGKRRHRFFEPSMHSAALDRIVLEAELRSAVDREEFAVHYQPIVELGTGRIIGAEALVRWQHPVRGMVSPASFIPLAESTGLILPIGRWVLEEACRQAGYWRRMQPDRPFKMSVNLSAWQLQDPSIVDTVRGALLAGMLEAEALTLEITETVMLHDTDTTLERLRELKALGVTLAVDDFGTGYSSLGYLMRFPVDVLKIDKTFVDELAAGGHDDTVTRAIIALGGALGLRTVAEGIEASDQVDGLVRLGCEYGQGYHFARPLTASDFDALFARPEPAPAVSVASAVHG